MLKQYKLKNFNIFLVLLVLVTCVVGVIFINSANSSFTKKQIFGICIGLFVILITSFIDYHYLLNFSFVLYIINIIVLIILRIPNVGHSVNGAVRWFRVGSILIQPSEVTKIVMIIFFANFLVTNMEQLNKFKTLFKIFLLLIVPIYLIKSQPDLSTTIALFLSIIAMIFVAGLSLKLITWVMSIAIPIFSIFIWYIQRPDQKILNPYQVERIVSWIHPEKYITSSFFQQYNSLFAIGSGKFLGKGLNNNIITSVKNGNYLQEPQTDFIFAIIGEESGFIGSLFVIILLSLIVFKCFSIARKAKDSGGFLIATGIGSLIGIQAFFNICVATAIMPNTGIPLPFISYGLSSLISMCWGIGVVINIGLQSSNVPVTRHNYGERLLKP